jgi:hypothetical protein
LGAERALHLEVVLARALAIVVSTWLAALAGPAVAGPAHPTPPESPPADLGWANFTHTSLSLGEWIAIDRGAAWSSEPRSAWVAVRIDLAWFPQRAEWATSRTCPALTSLVESLREFKRSEEKTPRAKMVPIFDIDLYTLHMDRGRWEAPHIRDYKGSKLGNLIDAAGEKMKDCWRPGVPERFPYTPEFSSRH